jgi:hypothetical protein
MKKIIASSILALFVLTLVAQVAEARSYYRSASSGRFTTKSYASSNKSTTYKSSFR